MSELSKTLMGVSDFQLQLIADLREEILILKTQGSHHADAVKMEAAIGRLEASARAFQSTVSLLQEDPSLEDKTPDEKDQIILGLRKQLEDAKEQDYEQGTSEIIELTPQLRSGFKCHFCSADCTEQYMNDNFPVCKECFEKSVATTIDELTPEELSPKLNDPIVDSDIREPLTIHDALASIELPDGNCATEPGPDDDPKEDPTVTV